jgi:gas vesicle protein
MDQMAAKDWVKGLVVGGLIGAALGILYAPKRGEENP